MIEGHCLCGAVTIRVAGGHDPRVGACHCRMCQRWSGGLFLCFSAPAASVHAEGPIRRHASSRFSERAFCEVCGSHLWMRDTPGENEPYDLMPGLFNGARAFPLRSEIYTDRAMACVSLSGLHERMTRAEYEAREKHLKGDMS
jgi:hypothetical protein